MWTEKQEQKEAKATTDLVDSSALDLKGERPGVGGGPDRAEVCSVIAMPTNIEELARRIQYCEEVAPDPHVKKRVKEPWWSREEGMDDEDGENEGGGG